MAAVVVSVLLGFMTARAVMRQLGDKPDFVPSIVKTSDPAQEIAAPFKSNPPASEINTAMNQMNQITRQNASASEEMTGQTEQLQSLKRFFKINGNATWYGSVRPKITHKRRKANHPYRQAETALKPSSI